MAFGASPWTENSAQVGVLVQHPTVEAGCPDLSALSLEDAYPLMEIRAIAERQAWGAVELVSRDSKAAGRYLSFEVWRYKVLTD